MSTRLDRALAWWRSHDDAEIPNDYLSALGPYTHIVVDDERTHLNHDGFVQMAIRGYLPVQGGGWASSKNPTRLAIESERAYAISDELLAEFDRAKQETKAVDEVRRRLRDG